MARVPVTQGQAGPAYGMRERRGQAVPRLLRRARRGLAAALALLALAPAAAAPPPERLVLALGDSLTAGYGLPPGRGFAPRLEAALRARGLRVRVHDAGVSGDTSAAGRARMGWVLRGIGATPALAVVELGANDMLRGLPPQVTRANLDAILTELDRRHIPVLLAGMRAAPNLGPAYVRAFESIYPQLAQRHRARLYPFFLAGVAGNPRLELPDHMHPTAPGVEVIVRGVAPVAAAMLR